MENLVTLWNMLSTNPLNLSFNFNINISTNPNLDAPPENPMGEFMHIDQALGEDYEDDDIEAPLGFDVRTIINEQ